MLIDDALHGISRLAFDTSPYIYMVENAIPFAEKVEYVFALVAAQQIEVRSSTITLAETLVKPIQLNDATTIQTFRNLLLNSKNIELIEVTTQIAVQSAHLRARYRLRTPDAIHIATAIHGNCDAFLTNDSALKRVTEIGILLLDDLELPPPSDNQP